jgi:hypothetical protein
MVYIIIVFYTYLGYNILCYNDLWKFNGSIWTWIAGSKEINQAGIYGIKGVPDQENTPSARNLASSWIDSSDHLYLFGGYYAPEYGMRFFLF